MKKPENFNDQLSVIIRSTGERTEALCREMVLAQGVNEDNLAIIRQQPFSLALRTSYEKGLAFGRPWTLCLDADVLLLPDSIGLLANLAGQQDSVVFEIQCLVLDKFFGGPREAGNHLYRTGFLNQALACIPENVMVARPEKQTIAAMCEHGHQWRRIDTIIGIHDFEQTYQDIFRKCFVQAKKHQKFGEIFMTYWPQQRASDYDFEIALKGLMGGLEYSGEAGIDSQQAVYREGFKKLGIKEKPALQSNEISSSEVAAIINNRVEPPVYSKYYHYKINNMSKLVVKKKQPGFFRLPLFYFGWGLEKVGRKIIRSLYWKQ